VLVYSVHDQPECLADVRSLITRRGALIKRKLREWLRRYLPAEAFGTVGALLGALIAHATSGNAVVVSYAGTWGENLGFYGYMAFREMRVNRRLRKPGQPSWVVLWRTVRNLVVEFGPAEYADSFLLRPFCMYLGQQATGSFILGILSGKVSADILFYFLAILFYELRKRWFKQ